ncbi:MAG: hypothetical protein AM325_007460 [Candidatus Thorarchaeota archaeon SMTZ1-45]|nr:MAG: hypothetical protein AM325_09190 [Candidatus Thorarchaeota archaeon SMTZ1-45]
MTNSRKKTLAYLFIALMVGSLGPISGYYLLSIFSPVSKSHILSGVPTDQVPLARVAFVSPNPASYVDEFAYMAAVPTSVFYFNDTQYISPLIYSEGSPSESWLLEDWSDYLSLDGGVTQAIAIGDFSENYLSQLQQDVGVKIYPRITGSSAAEIASLLAANAWSSSSTAVIGLLKENYDTPSTITGGATHVLQNQASEILEFGGTVTYGAPSSINFTPPSWAVWLEGRFNWTGSELLTHELIDPYGEIVDYSVWNQIYFSRQVGYVVAPVPLNFWLPKVADGTWTMNITRDIAGTTTMDNEVVCHPGYARTVSVPVNAKWMNVSLQWDNVATDLNLALIDPTGRLAMWAPAGSILSNPGREIIRLPYPMPGDWTIIAAWMNANEEQNNINLSWTISSLPTDLEFYMESAANAAVLASLLNAPLLYVYEDQIPTETDWALTRLNVSNLYLVDPSNLQDGSLAALLSSYGALNNLISYPLVTSAIASLSGSRDVVVTVPVGNGNEFFAPAAFSAAVHGSPVFSLCGTNNELTTRAQETWAPYLIGPEINNIYVINKYENRAENGWYDERIPNKYSMMESEASFEAFLTSRGAYNSTFSQPIVVISPASLLPLSFDRSLQSHFNPGRIPATKSTTASILINRGLLHRFLFLTADQSDTSLVSMYAYTDGDSFIDNNYDYHVLYQIENTTDALEAAGFSIESHVGQNEVFQTLDSQVALWSLSTHGTLTELPRDPPDRPYGVGYFSLRNADAPYGFEESLTIRESPSDSYSLVNPVAFPEELANHVTKSSHDLDAAIGNIGSPIIILTACLLGGTEMPLMLMEHGAVAVTAAPRTVYFRPAGMLSVLLTQSLCAGSTISEALSYGLTTTSIDYSDPLIGRDPRDYANQQILFGDPSVQLYEPVTSPHVAAVNPLTSSFDGHVPGQGIGVVAALGVSSYLPSTLTSLSVVFDYYEVSNYTEFLRLLPLRHIVLVEPDTLDVLGPSLSSSSNVLDAYVRNGGVLVLFGVSESIPWLPWPMSYEATGSGTSITIVDATHPLLTSPNALSSTINYTGHFSSVWANLTVLATDGLNPVIVAGAVGSGKVAFSTTFPSGANQNTTIENAVYWSVIPSITLESVTLSQRIIWAGDDVTIFIELTDIVGAPIESADLDIWLNSSQVTAIETGNGFYSILLTGGWTQANTGQFDLYFIASKAGYDTLTLSIEQFILIRPFPWVMLGIIGGGLVIVVGGWVYWKKRRGDSIGWKRDSSPEDKQKEALQREKDSKSDVKEYFGV